MAEDLDTLAALVASLEANPPRCYSVQNPVMDYQSMMGTNAAAMQHHAAMQQRYYQNGMGQQTSPRGHDLSPRQDMMSQRMSPRQPPQAHQPQRSPLSQRSPMAAPTGYGAMDASQHAYYMQKQGDPRAMGQHGMSQQQQQQQRMYAAQLAAHQMATGPTEIKPEDYAMMNAAAMGSHPMSQRPYPSQYSSQAGPPPAHMNYSRSTSSVPPAGARMSQHHGMYSNYHPAFRQPQRYGGEATHMNSQYAMQRYPGHSAMGMPMREPPPPYRPPPQTVRPSAEVRPPDDNPPGVINIVPLPPSPPPPAAAAPEPTTNRRRSRGRDDPNVIVIDSPTPTTSGEAPRQRSRRTESQVIDLDPDDDSNDGDLILVGATTRRGTELPPTSGTETPASVIREAPQPDAARPASQPSSTPTTTASQATVTTTASQRAPSPRLSSENSAWVMDQIKSLLQSYQNAVAGSSSAVTSVAGSRQAAGTTLTTATDSPISVGSSNSEESRNNQAQNSATIGTEMNKVASSLLHNLAQRLAGVCTTVDTPRTENQERPRRSSTQVDPPAGESCSQAPQPVNITPQPATSAAPIEISPQPSTQGTNSQLNTTTVTSSGGSSQNSQSCLPGAKPASTFQSAPSAHTASRATSSVPTQPGAAQALQALAGGREPQPHVIAPMSENHVPAPAQYLRAGQYTNTIPNGHQHTITRQLNPAHFNGSQQPPGPRPMLHPAFPTAQHMVRPPQPYSGIPPGQTDPRHSHPAAVSSAGHPAPHNIQLSPMPAGPQMASHPGQPANNHTPTSYPATSQPTTQTAHSQSQASNEGPAAASLSNSSSSLRDPLGLGDHMPELPMSFLDHMLGDFPEEMLANLGAALAGLGPGNNPGTNAAHSSSSNAKHATGAASSAARTNNRSALAKSFAGPGAALPSVTPTGPNTTTAASNKAHTTKQHGTKNNLLNKNCPSLPPGQPIPSRGQQQQPSRPEQPGTQPAGGGPQTNSNSSTNAISSTGSNPVCPDAEKIAQPVSSGHKPARSTKSCKSGSKTSRSQTARAEVPPSSEANQQEPMDTTPAVTTPASKRTTTPKSQANKSPGSSSSSSRTSGSRSPKGKAPKSKAKSKKSTKKKTTKKSRPSKATPSKNTANSNLPSGEQGCSLTTRSRSRKKRSVPRPNYREPPTPPSPPREYTFIPHDQLQNQKNPLSKYVGAGTKSIIGDAFKSLEGSSLGLAGQPQNVAMEVDPKQDLEIKPPDGTTEGVQSLDNVTMAGGPKPSRKPRSSPKKDTSKSKKKGGGSSNRSPAKKKSKAPRQSPNKAKGQAAASSQSGSQAVVDPVVAADSETCATTTETKSEAPDPQTLETVPTDTFQPAVTPGVASCGDNAAEPSSCATIDTQSVVPEPKVMDENNEDSLPPVPAGITGEPVCSSQPVETATVPVTQEVSTESLDPTQLPPVSAPVSTPVSIPPPPLIPSSQLTASQALVNNADITQCSQSVIGENVQAKEDLPQAISNSMDTIHDPKELTESIAKVIAPLDTEPDVEPSRDSTHVVASTSVSTTVSDSVSMAVSESVCVSSQATRTSQSLTSTSLVMSSRVSQLLTSTCSSSGRRPGSAPPLRLATPSPPPLVSAPLQLNLPVPTAVAPRQTTPSPPPLVRVSESTKQGQTLVASHADRQGTSTPPTSGAVVDERQDSAESVSLQKEQEGQQSLPASSSSVAPELLQEGLCHGNPLPPATMVSEGLEGPSSSVPAVPVVTEAQAGVPTPSMVVGMPNATAALPLIMQPPPYNGSAPGGPPTTDSQALALQMARGVSYMPVISGPRGTPLVVSSYPFLHPAVPQMLAVAGPGGLPHGLPFVARLPHRHGVHKPGPAHGPIPGPTGSIDEPSPFLSPSHTPVDLSEDSSLLPDPSLLAAGDGSGMLFEPPEPKEPEYITMPDIDIPEEPTVIRRRRNTARKSCYSDRYRSRKRKIDGTLIAKCEEFYQYWKDNKPLPAALQTCFLPNVNLEQVQLDGKSYTSARGVLMQQLVKERWVQRINCVEFVKKHFILMLSYLWIKLYLNFMWMAAVRIWEKLMTL